MISRRNLLQGIFAAGIAPAIVKAEILMPVRKIIVPEWGMGILTATEISRRHEIFNQRFREIEMSVNQPLICRHRKWLVEANGTRITWIETPMGIQEFQQFSMKGIS